MGNASRPEAAPGVCLRTRQKLLDSIFARIAVISISFGAAGGFCSDYPIIQILLSRGRAPDKTLFFSPSRVARRPSGARLNHPCPNSARDSIRYKNWIARKAKQPTRVYITAHFRNKEFA